MINLQKQLFCPKNPFRNMSFSKHSKIVIDSKIIVNSHSYCYSSTTFDSCTSTTHPLSHPCSLFLGLLCALFIHYPLRTAVLCSSHHVICSSIFVGLRSQLLARPGVCLEPYGFGNNCLGILLKYRHIKHIIVPCRRNYGTSARVHTSVMASNSSSAASAQVAAQSHCSV